jgi:hypothetical protein
MTVETLARLMEEVETPKPESGHLPFVPGVL